MSERMNMGSNPEGQKKQQEKKDIEREASHFGMHLEQFKSPANSREVGPEITEFENMVASFEATHSFAELEAIVDLSPDLLSWFTYADSWSDEQVASAIKNFTPEYTEEYKKKIATIKATVLSPEDAKIFATRRTAMKDLALIAEKLEVIKKETDISPEKLEEIKKENKRLAIALGSLRKGKIDHDR